MTLHCAVTDTARQEFLALTAHSFHELLFGCHTLSLKFSPLSRRAEMKVPLYLKKKKKKKLEQSQVTCLSSDKCMLEVRGRRRRKLSCGPNKDDTSGINRNVVRSCYIIRCPEEGLGTCRGYQWGCKWWEWLSRFIRQYFLWTSQLLSHI